MPTFFINGTQQEEKIQSWIVASFTFKGTLITTTVIEFPVQLMLTKC